MRDVTAHAMTSVEGFVYTAIICATVWHCSDRPLRMAGWGLWTIAGTFAMLYVLLSRL
jgi:hypothetical protein